MRSFSSSDHTSSSPRTAGRLAGGFSLTEMIITISILAVLAGIVLMSVQGTYEASRAVLARERVEMLNHGLVQFAQHNYEMIFNQRLDSGADELVVLRSLQFRNPDVDLAKIGSPYISPSYNPLLSSDADDYRIRWTGRMYELIRPGENGMGIRMVFDGSDMTEAFKFPPNFQMAGR